MGFTVQQLGEFRERPQANGFSSIDFKPDPQIPQFYQVHAGSRGRCSGTRPTGNSWIRAYDLASLSRKRFPAGQGTGGAELMGRRRRERLLKEAALSNG